MSSITYQNSQKSERGKLTKNEFFESPILCSMDMRLRVLSVVSLEFKATCSMGYQRQREFLVFPPWISPFIYQLNKIIVPYKILKSAKTRKAYRKYSRCLAI